MRVTYILDTNTFSYIVSGRSPAARAEFRRLVQPSDARLCISVFTEAEARFGMKKRNLSAERQAAIGGILRLVDILPWGSEEAETYANALRALNAAGIGMSLFDLLIGVHAATTGAVLVSHDQVFSRAATHIGIAHSVDWATDI